MLIIITKDYQELSEKTSELISEKIKEKNNLVLGLATGSTPKGIYENLIKKYQNQEISFKDVISFNLDEYVGIESNHKESYRYFMDNKFFNHIDIDKTKTFVPSGIGDIAQNAKDFENKLSSFGPVNLQILGLGLNGHIGFNEPGSWEVGRTKETTLTTSTIEANKRFFDNIKEDVPKTAISMGIGTILDSESIILMASGEKKALAVQKMIEGKITSDVPASFLQKHTDVTIIIDEAAASLLNR